ncbi:MAG TPA: type 4a pilus biogenesis protein PilO [Patescibacteria group bacterium]|nr:type 4a pilus biogenesis protein PilO [Patescibacteria group bacterium]
MNPVTQKGNIQEKNQTKKIQDIHRRKYLANIHLLPDLQQKKLKEYLEVIFTFVAIILAVIFAIGPVLSTISDLNRQITDAKTEDTALATKITSLTQLNQQYNSLQSVLPNIYSAVPQSEESELFLADLQSLAQLDNVTITNINAQNNNNVITTGAQMLSFSLSLSGNYSAIQNFIQDSINFQRMIVPISIVLTTNSVQNNEINLIINGNAYYTL